MRRAELVPPPVVPGVWITGPAARVELVEPVTVRRAEFVHPARDPVTVQRAQLVAPPIGTSGPVIMPCDGRQITATYRGEVPTFDDLPKNPSPNDMYKVTESGQEWVWYQLANFSHSAWVDP